jgi:hypothetical protein
MKFVLVFLLAAARSLLRRDALFLFQSGDQTLRVINIFMSGRRCINIFLQEIRAFLKLGFIVINIAEIDKTQTETGERVRVVRFDFQNFFILDDRIVRISDDAVNIA